MPTFTGEGGIFCKMSVGLPCQPFGPTIQCTCDKRGQALRCLPVVELARKYEGGLNDGNLWNREGEINTVVEMDKQLKNDQRTEIILALTLLVIVVLTFLL